MQHLKSAEPPGAGFGRYRAAGGWGASACSRIRCACADVSFCMRRMSRAESRIPTATQSPAMSAIS